MDVLAAIPQLDSIQNIVITLVSAFIFILLLVRLAGALGRRAWAEMVIDIVGVIIVGYFVWAPDDALATLQGISADIFS